MSEGKRVALIVACDRYADPELKALRAPSQDAEAFARILEDPKIGDFRVKRLINEPYYVIREKIDEFLQSCNREDSILLYFSCHGIKDRNGHLYFATITTNRKRLLSTGVESNFVNNLLDQCRAQQKVVLLDCCYSGAFEKGRTVRADKQINVTEFFGEGTVIITASDSMQYAFEGDDRIDLGNSGSYFTNALIKGLESGEADIDSDGEITYKELYDYVAAYIRGITPDQTPTFTAHGVKGPFMIFRNPKHDPRSVIKPMIPTGYNEEKDIYEQSDPNFFPFIKRGRILLEEKEYDDAIKIFDSVLILTSVMPTQKYEAGHVEALNGKGMALYKQRKYEGALGSFNETLKIKPKNLEANTFVEIINKMKSKESRRNAKPSDKDRRDDSLLEKHSEKKVIKALEAFELLKENKVAEFNEITRSFQTIGTIEHGYLAHERKFQHRLDFTGKDIGKASLSGIDLHEADICRTILVDSDLSNANLNWANLASSRLDRAKLSGANLENTYLSQTNLSYADLSEAKLSKALLLAVNLHHAKLSNANLYDSIIVGCENYDELECINADFDGATIDEDELVEYLKTHKARNVPSAVTSKKELISKLKKKGYKGRVFDKIMERSVFRKRMVTK